MRKKISINYLQVGRVINALPLIIPLATICLGIISVGLLLVGQLSTVLVLLLGLPLSVVVTKLVIPHINNVYRHSNITIIINVLVLLFVFCWIIFNAFYSAEHLLTNRDASMYTNTAIRIIDHNDTNFMVVKPLGDNTSLDTSGFETIGNKFHVFGAHMLPALMGLMGRIVGEAQIFHTPAVLGGIALLSFFSLARLLLKPGWAAFAMLMLGLSLPMIYFSRNAYSEPLSLMVIFMAITIFWHAHKNQNISLWFLSGLLFGASAMVRIDNFLTAGAALGTAWLITMILGKKVSRRAEQARLMIAFMLGIIITVTLGWLELYLNSKAYFTSHTKFILPLLAVMIFVIVAGLAITMLHWRTNLIEKLDKVTASYRVPVGVAVLSVGILVLISRPLWMVSSVDRRSGIIENTQREEGLSIDGTQRYWEYSVNWLGNYLGHLLVAVAFIGLVYIFYKLLRRKNYELIMLFVVVLISSMLYLVRPSISPDHIWAARRFLPVIIPGFILIGIYTVSLIIPKLNKRLHINTLITKSLIFCVVLVTLVIPPILTTKPFIGLQTHAQYETINDVCLYLPKSETRVVWLGFANTIAMQPVRTVCDVPGLAFGESHRKMSDGATRGELREIYLEAKAQDITPYVALFRYQRWMIDVKDHKNLSEVATFQDKDIKKTLINPTGQTEHFGRDILLGKLKSDGSLVKPDIVND